MAKELFLISGIDGRGRRIILKVVDSENQIVAAIKGGRKDVRRVVWGERLELGGREVAEKADFGN